ncbi:type II toxin-antitoxin system HicB family antitoxin [Planktothrix agardhii]|jgi:predicted RNase H-like HicB family nuclease|nr:type II toxin-antitoxin system HicB family antitoxin [Planktothrix agardhii]
MPIDFYSVVLKKSAGYRVALCLENEIVAQGDNPEQSMSKLQEAIESFLLVSEAEEKVDQSPILMK